MESCFSAFCINWCQTKPTPRGGFCCGSSSSSDVLDDIEREQREHKLKKSESRKTKASEQDGREGSIRSTRSNRLRRASQASQPDFAKANGDNQNEVNTNSQAADANRDEKWRNMVENRARSRSWSGDFDEADSNSQRKPSVEMPVPQWGLPPSPTIYQPTPHLPMQIPPIEIPESGSFSEAFEASIPPSLRPGSSPISSPEPVYSSPTDVKASETGFDTRATGDTDSLSRTPNVGAQVGMPAYPQPAYQVHSHSPLRYGTRDGTAELYSNEDGDLGIPGNMYTGDDDRDARMHFPIGEANSPDTQYVSSRPAWQRERRFSRDGSEIGVVVDEQRFLGS